MKNILLFIIRTAHFLALLFIVFGWLSWSKTFLLMHIIFVPIVIVQWVLNDGTCFLTNLENFILAKEINPKEEQGQFIKLLLSRCFNPLPSDQKIKFTIYAVMWTSCGISLSRWLFW